MEGPFVSTPAKRPFDLAGNMPESNGKAVKKRNSAAFHPHKPPPPPLKLSPGETLFRILCPAIRTGGVIGKGGSIIKQFREDTGAKIRIEEPVPGCDERVIVIVGPVSENARVKAAEKNPAPEKEEIVEDEDGNAGVGEETDKEAGAANSEEGSPVQQALLMVFERILQVEEELMGISGEGEANERKVAMQGAVACRLLVLRSQVGCVIGKGGSIVGKIRQESGAQIRVLSKDQIPGCAAATDELIQIQGSGPAVKKALLAVSTCLQNNPKSDMTNLAAAVSYGSMARGTGPPPPVDPLPQRGYVSGAPALDHSSSHSSITGADGIAAGHRKVLEEEVVFKLLCLNDQVGGVIGRGGAIIRALQSETGASIKIIDTASDSEERVVVISARENSEFQHSPAQDAVIRVHGRIIETAPEKGPTVSARLLVPSHHIGCLMGKGGAIIAEMRRASGAGIQISTKDQVPKCASEDDQVVQVIGSLQSVHDALFHITGRLRDIIFPIKPHPGVRARTFSSATQGMPPSSVALHSSFGARIDPTTPGSYASIGASHGPDRSYGQPALAHSMDRLGLTNVDRAPYPYGGERPVHGAPTFDGPSSPRPWASQPVSSGNLRGPDFGRGIPDIGRSLAPRSGGFGSGSQTAIVTSTTVEVVVPQRLMGSIYGENGSNLNQIRQISGAKVVMHGPRPGASEGLVVISGTPDKTHAAQSLLQAFILSGQNSP